MSIMAIIKIASYILLQQRVQIVEFFYGIGCSVKNVYNNLGEPYIKQFGP